jgi:hypothetical protein
MPHERRRPLPAALSPAAAHLQPAAARPTVRRCLSLPLPAPRPLIVRRACRVFPVEAGGGRGAQHAVSDLSLRFQNGQHGALGYITPYP